MKYMILWTYACMVWFFTVLVSLASPFPMLLMQTKSISYEQEFDMAFGDPTELATLNPVLDGVITWIESLMRIDVAYATDIFLFLYTSIDEGETAWENEEPFDIANWLEVASGTERGLAMHSRRNFMLFLITAVNDEENIHIRKRLNLPLKMTQQLNYHARVYSAAAASILTSGAAELSTFIKHQVCGRVPFNDMLNGIQFTFAYKGGEDLSVQIRPPCAGYYTNVRMQVANISAGEGYSVYFGKNLPTLQFPDVGVATGFLHNKDLDKYGCFFRWEQGDPLLDSSVQPGSFLHHFGKKKFFVKHDDMPLIASAGPTITNSVIIIQADFIPFKGATYREKLIASSGADPEDDFEYGFGDNPNVPQNWSPNVKLIDVVCEAQFHTIASAEGSGEINFIKVRRENKSLIDEATTLDSIEMHGDFFIDESVQEVNQGVTSQGGTVGNLVYNSKQRDVTVKKFFVGTMDYGDILTWALREVDPTTFTNSSLVLNFTGIVADRHSPLFGEFVTMTSAIDPMQARYGSFI